MNTLKTLALASGAQATVVYMPESTAVPVAVGSGSPRVYIDFDTFTLSTTAISGYDMSLLDIIASTANGGFKYNRVFAIGATATTGSVLDAQTSNQVGNTASLSTGTLVNGASPFHQYGALAQHFYSSGGAVYNYGNFQKAGTQYLGFDFKNSAGNTEYGWMSVTFNTTAYAAGTSALTVTGIAYDNTGLPVRIGSLVAVPEPGAMALGCLAAGAVGLGFWRRKRAETASVVAQA